MVFGFGVQGDPELDLHIPPGDADLLDEQSQEFLFFFGPEVVDHRCDSSGESLHSAADLVIAAEFSALRGEVVTAGGELCAAVFDIAGAALHLGEREQPGLVEICEAPAFVVGPQ